MTSLTALEMFHQKRRLAKVLSRPPDLVVGIVENVFSPQQENVGISGVSGYQLQMLQMSSASVERMVRDMEAKVNKLLDLQGSWRNDRGYHTQSGDVTNQKKKSGEIDADELMNNITSYIKENEIDKSRFIRSCAKDS